jgi:transcription elongation factor Elf1
VVKAVLIRQRWKRKGGRMEKETEIMRLAFENRILEVKYNSYKGKRNCPVCGNKAIVFKIVEIKDLETGSSAEDISLKSHRIRRLIIENLDYFDPDFEHCEKCGAAVELVLSLLLKDKDSGTFDATTYGDEISLHTKEELIRASIEGRPPDDFS